jgi:hypothetical protein
MAKGQIKQKQDNISRSLFEKLCSIQCTKEEICAVLEVSEKTLNSWCNNVYGKNFSLVFSEKREYGKSSLRRTQWKLAEKNPTMAIWLGKQYLGQRDNIEVEHDMKNGVLNDLVGALNKAKESK